MPQIVAHDIPASQIKVGDEVEFPGARHTEMVDDIDRKVKWTTISTDYGKRRIEVTDIVKVFRSEPTEEETAAERRQWILTRIERATADAAANVVLAKSKLIEALDMAPNWHDSMWENYVAAQTTDGIWRYVARIVENNSEAKGDPIIAMQMLREEMTDQLIEAHRGSNQSSSQLHNVRVAIEEGAKAVWLRSFRWDFSI